MKRLLIFLFPVVGAALLFIGSPARADMCLNGPGGNEPADAKPADSAVSLRTGKLPRQLGAGFLFAAGVSSGWLCFRRTGPKG
jgi:hypothetical protein